MLLTEGINLLPDRTFFAQLAIFLIVLFMLSRFVFKPVLKVLKLRKHHTEGERKRIEELAKKSQVMMEEYSKKIAQARLQASQLKENIRQEGELRGSELIQTSKNIARQEIERVRQEIQKSANKAKSDLEKQAENLGTEIAEKVVGRKLQKNGH